MITSLSLKNFKVFRSLNNLRVAPITVLSGKNSSGKSSVLHSLLLLKQSLTDELLEEALVLDGTYLQYTHLREIAYDLPVEAIAAIEYDFLLRSPDNGLNGRIAFEIRNKPLPKNPKRKGPVINRLTWESSKDHGTIRLRKGSYTWPADVKIELPTMPKDVKASGRLRVEFQHFLPHFFLKPVTFEEEGKRNTGYLHLSMSYQDVSLVSLCRLLREELSLLRYLGPSRAVPRRAYVHYSARHYELDDDGANAAHIFWLRRNELVNWKQSRIPLHEAVYNCLKLMGLHQPVKPKRSSRFVYQILVGTGLGKQKDVTLADVGFGYSQVLPIILRGLLSEQNALLLFEQPEIHLHPSAKARLADLLIAFKESGRRMIVETHSTELINCLQLRVLEEKCPPEDINVSFVSLSSDKASQGASVKQLSLAQDGMFDEWPDGFCDESEKLSRKILETSVKKEVSYA